MTISCYPLTLEHGILELTSFHNTRHTRLQQLFLLNHYLLHVKYLSSRATTNYLLSLIMHHKQSTHYQCLGHQANQSMISFYRSVISRLCHIFKGKLDQINFTRLSKGFLFVCTTSKM